MEFKLVVILTFVSKVNDALYVSQQNLSFCFPDNAEQGLLLGRVFAHTSMFSDCSETDLEYALMTADGTKNVTQYFEIFGSGWIRLASPLDGTSKEGQRSFNFLMEVKCKSDSNVQPLVVPVTLRQQTSSMTGSIQKDDIRRYCFGDLPKTFQIEENVENASLGLLRGCSDNIFNSSTVEITMKIVNGNFSQHFLLDPNTSELRVVKSLDRETVKSVELSVICNSTLPTPTSVTETIRIKILDVNDNLPYFEKTSNRSLEVNCNVTGTQCRIISGVVIDPDEDQAVPHTVEILDDPFGVCRAEKPICYQVNNSLFCRLAITTDGLELTPEPAYSCTAALIDEAYVGLLDKLYNKSAVMKINFHNSAAVKLSSSYQTEHKFVHFYRNATRFARLIELGENRKKRKHYSLVNPIFRVTPSYGIVYVYDETALRQAPASMILRVLASPSLLINITVQMQGEPRKDIKGCEAGCSRIKSLDQCESSCGLGITTGNCVFRKVENNQKYLSSLKTYETCSYNTSTCPDHRCDELEELNLVLCPQDCTTKNIIGAGFLDESSKGIKSCMSPAWCDRSAQCFCTYPIVPTQAPTSLESFQLPMHTLEITTVIEANNTSMERQVTAISSDSDKEICDHYCRTVIGASIGSLACFIFILIILWTITRKRKGRKSNLKHVGSLLSISAVPSDYIVDRERQSSYPSPIWTPKQPFTSSTRQEDLEWEFPRENLYLEETLGEGEFGVVIKAKAKGLAGQDGFMQVAIKMLKHCSTPSEEQDLWSEFNLLKDVTHPNVIRLLGACTKDGPLYLIVEYCANGCLLNYLRNSCLEEKGYVNQHVSYRTPNNNNNKEIRQNGETLTIRDLLSFAWQIAKGMRYLSDIKLVHRDLAARNVLVAAGKHLKISDFGLTRDIYEADAYLKKSRGRIPVKWMAPESLYAQIYTTKSDVWSYGIVLWELVTLGASPYPGIPPERLYSLLVGGYRMDRPEQCPEEMYAVMQKCWKIDPQDRPKFRAISDILDRILQEKTGYLDLNSGFDENPVNMLLEDRFCSREKDHPGRSNLYTKKQDVEELGSSFSSSSTYLTPSSNVLPDCEEKSSSPLFGRKNVIYPSEKQTLLKDMDTVKFINVQRQITDSAEELEPLTFGAS